jgi:hypothetical protein
MNQERYIKLRGLVEESDELVGLVKKDLKGLNSIMEPFEEEQMVLLAVKDLCKLSINQSEILLMLAYPQLSELEDDS